MDNKVLMSILAQLQKNHNQKQAIYLMCGTILLGGIVMVYLSKKNTALSNNIKSLNGINDSLADQLGQQEQELSIKQWKINQLEKDNHQLSQNIVTLRQEMVPEDK